MSKVKRQLVTHTFKGEHFEDHGLDLDVLPGLYAYKELLVAAAKELWWRHHPDRQRLPKNFEDSLCLKFYQLQESSVAVPIYREVEVASQTEMFQFEQPDELDEAVLLVAEGVDAANSDRPLPDSLPKNITALPGIPGQILTGGDADFSSYGFGNQVFVYENGSTYEGCGDTVNDEFSSK